MKIFTTSYYKGLYLLLNNGFAVKILEQDGRIVFGKLTMSIKNSLSKNEALKLFKVNEEYLQYFIDNYNKFQVIWNVNYNGHKIGDVYLPEHSGTYPGYPWNFVCHHIGYYRRHGERAIDDSWKLGVKGLNCQIFNKFKNKTIHHNS